MFRTALLVLFTILFSCGNVSKDHPDSEENTTTTYYLIRHAEKDRNTTENPDLTEVGKQRAAFWADYFEGKNLDAVYSTAYNRTRQTATPTAESQNISLKYYNPSQMYDATFKEETFGKNVLIVGHSNTTPAFVNAILGENRYTDIDDSENAMLYTVILNDDIEAQVTLSKVEMN